MDDLKFWSWDKKNRTMLRFIKPGDIFCFEIPDGKFGFGRIVSKVSVGHSAEIFDYVAGEPYVSDVSILNSTKVALPLILDSYSLFDKKISGDWRVVGHQSKMPVKDFKGIYFVYGVPGEYKKVDMFGCVSNVSDEEFSNYPAYTPRNNYHVMSMLSL